MARNTGNLNECLREDNGRLRRVLIHGLIGALAGYLLLHPLSMLIHTRYYGHESDPLHFLVLSFSAEHLNMAFYFAALGAFAGMIQGYYAHRLRILYEQAKCLSLTDELTLLHNRRYLLEELRREMKRSGRSGRPLSVMMIDIDRFKQYNDTYGHPAGDRLLKEFSRELGCFLRDTDIVARYGGEEFAVVMPDTPRIAAYRIAERLRTRTQENFSTENRPSFNGDITLSIGVAEFGRDAGSLRQLIGSADTALYRAKQLGRNRVCLAGETCQDMQEVHR